MKVSIDFIQGYTNDRGNTTHGVFCNNVQRTLIQNGIYYVVYEDNIITSMFPIHNIAKITETKE